MLKLTNNQISKLKKIILDYIHGEAVSVIKVRLEMECTAFKTSCKSLYKKIALVNKDDILLIAILSSLKIKKTTHPASNRYDKLLNKSNNLYELLENLSHDGNHQINYLLKIIGNTKPPPNWTIVWMTTAVSGTVLGFLIYLNRHSLNAFQAWIMRKFPVIIQWLKNTFSLLRNIPLLGIIYNSISLILSWYRTFANGSMTTVKKLQRQCFKTLTAGLNIVGYTLSFIASGIITIPSAIFFVLAAGNDVFHSLFDWYQHRKAYTKLKHHNQKPKNDKPWEVLAEYERAKNLHRRSLNSVWIRVSSALLVTATVAIWSFCPPSLIITFCCVVFISLLAITSKSVIWSINEVSARHLQKALKKIPALPEDELRPKDPEPLDQMHASTQLNQAKEDLINRWEKTFLKEAYPKKLTTQPIYQSTSLVLLGLGMTNSPSSLVENAALVSIPTHHQKESDLNPDSSHTNTSSSYF